MFNDVRGLGELQGRLDDSKVHDGLAHQAMSVGVTPGGDPTRGEVDAGSKLERVTINRYGSERSEIVASFLIQLGHYNAPNTQ
jgi:hypothetical protein